MTSNGQKISAGIDNNLRDTLEKVTVHIDDIQHRLDAFLVTTDHVVSEEIINKLNKVRTTMAKVPIYREKCTQVQKKMENCDRRAAALAQSSKILRSQLPVKAPFVEEFPLESELSLFYRVIYGGGISIRSEPSFDAPRIGVIAYNEIFRGAVRICLNGKDIFVGLENNFGWVFESKDDIPVLERVSNPLSLSNQNNADCDNEDGKSIDSGS
mmetsp:Transcript_2873/g.3971  ORF Transcript_2873/g.3971 Transcript_2873/m.3971 type:complete len:212 (+) Transcript_2873:113-748(+)